jgi:8-oxo-dGTP pyrophosphatase MutT (NUDIX family)
MFGKSKMLEEKIRRILSQREKQTIVLTEAPLAPAAVLVPLYEKDGEHYILFTKRTQRVEHHKGQICFPGGARHEEDRSPLDTALRETFEEVGVKPEDVEILGELDRMGTLTSNFLITPFVGIIPYPYEFTVSKDEIEELVEVPISALLDKENYHEEFQVYEGRPYLGSFFEYKGKVIWGATAMILKQFLALVFGSDVRKA